MGQLLVRNLDDRVVKRLKARARRKGQSLHAEVKTILEEAADMEMRWRTGWKRLDAIRKSLEGRRFEDSAKLIRRARDDR